MSRLNLGQRIVVVIGLAAGLVILGAWAMTWGTHSFTGWTGYAPLSRSIYVPSGGGLHLWALALIWLALISIWVVVSVVVLRGPRRPVGGGDADR
jgi:heme/copper-type cytochrome/quinol oxidase subunit 1